MGKIENQERQRYSHAHTCTHMQAHTPTDNTNENVMVTLGNVQRGGEV